MQSINVQLFKKSTLTFRQISFFCVFFLQFNLASVLHALVMLDNLYIYCIKLIKDIFVNLVGNVFPNLLNDSIFRINLLFNKLIE